jgi:tight adherence protein B
MIATIDIFKYAALAALLLSGSTFALWSVLSERLPGTGFVDNYTRVLDARLRRMFMPTRGRVIFMAQALALLIAAAALLMTRDLLSLAPVPCILLAPHFVLSRLEHQRMLRIEAKVDAFTVALANALRATPNVGRALASVVMTMPAPMNQELELTLRDLRVGSSLDQALTDFSARVGSTTLDTTISALLIGRRVGGNVPQILTETGASVREMTRLQAVLRAKTADGRIQTIVLAAFPVGVVLVFELLSPGYFKPLTTTGVGAMIIGGACALWVVALGMCRQIMKVQL